MCNHAYVSKVGVGDLLLYNLTQVTGTFSPIYYDLWVNLLFWTSYVIGKKFKLVLRRYVFCCPVYKTVYCLQLLT